MKLPAPAFWVFQQISATCEREKLILPQSLLVAGVSGGADSMLLLAFLLHYLQKIPFDLVACHLNHGIRGSEADLDQALVKDYCEKHSIPFVALYEDLPAYAQKAGLGLEEAGRIVRRRSFEKVAADYGEKKDYPGGCRIALAHHQDDRAESILMHMGRGAGLRGLVGIRYLDGPLIRPLLDIRRDQVVEAAQALNLPWREDASNLSFEFLRNRIRLDLIPAWEKTLGYDPVPMLARLGDLAKMDHDALSAMASESLDSLRLPDGSLSLTDLASLPEALTSRVLQQYCGQVKEGEDGSQSLSQNQVATLAGLMVSVTSGNKEKARLSLGGGVTAIMCHGRLWLEAESYEEKDGGKPSKSQEEV